MVGNTRRRLLKNSALALSTVFGSSSLAAGSSSSDGSPRENRGTGRRDFDWKRVRQNLIARYGKSEGGRAYSIARQNIRQAEKEGLSRDECWESIKRQLLDNPKTRTISQEIKDIESTDEELREVDDERVFKVGSSLDAGMTSSLSSTSTMGLNFAAKTTELDSTLNTRVDAAAHINDNRLHSVSNSAAVGSGVAIARLHSLYLLPETTDYTISVDYYRNSDVVAASGEISVYTIDDFYGLRKYKLEDVNGQTGSTTRSATVHMEADRTYEIGVEVKATSSTAGTLAYTDVYNCISFGCPDGRHRVELNGNPVMKW